MRNKFTKKQIAVLEGLGFSKCEDDLFEWESPDYKEKKDGSCRKGFRVYIEINHDWKCYWVGHKHPGCSEAFSAGEVESYNEFDDAVFYAKNIISYTKK